MIFSFYIYPIVITKNLTALISNLAKRLDILFSESMGEYYKTLNKVVRNRPVSVSFSVSNYSLHYSPFLSSLPAGLRPGPRGAELLHQGAVWVSMLAFKLNF